MSIGGLNKMTKKAKKFGFGISKPRSWYGWELWQFIKGRKKMAVTVIGAMLGYFLSNNANIGLISGVIVEGLWASAEFYFKEVNLK